MVMKCGSEISGSKNYKIAGSNADDEVKAEVYCILFKPDKDVFERGINIPAILIAVKTK